MKKIILPVMFLAATSCATAAETELERPNPQFVSVSNPEIPMSYTFAGENVNLDRVDMTECLDRELTSMVYTHGNTLLTIKRANRFFPMMEPILKKNGIHPDFLYLACIESYLNPLARSGAGAVGIWQFMPATAKEYGLEVNDEVDERYHFIKETEAACKYFKRAFAKYGNWESVAASYNGGTGRIDKELSAQNVNSAFDLWLVEETRRYPYRMMAMKMIMENPSDYGFTLGDHQLYQPLEYTVETVSAPVADWAVWAQNHGIDYQTLREYNPWIRDKKLTNKSGKTYQVWIPKADSLLRSSRKVSTYNSNWTK